MATQTHERNLFLVGALVGVLGGFIVGSVATIELEDKVRKLVHAQIARLFGRQQTIRWELLGQ